MSVTSTSIWCRPEHLALQPGAGGRAGVDEVNAGHVAWRHERIGAQQVDDRSARSARRRAADSSATTWSARSFLTARSPPPRSSPKPLPGGPYSHDVRVIARWPIGAPPR